LNQAPPRAQQLSLFVFLLTTVHLGHAGRFVAAVVATVVPTAVAAPNGADIGGYFVKEIQRQNKL